ncbi:OmpA family protein [Arundinibacter roseus]|uniref:OmpA family protein n=1 Tax=Arundinibacter roseus TaxID=2070510 RepID=A0A4R4KMA8_9BACT|nr:OmpA family protein [Arundinibacter roseus]TDB68156.1 OmpA family protein [Arundinibacter roseus]
MRYLFLILLASILIPDIGRAQITTAQRPVTLFTIKAVDDKTGKEIPANFSVLLHSVQEKYTGANRAGEDYFNVKMYSSDTVTIETSSEGYYTIEEILLVSCDTCGFYQYTALMEKRVDSVFTDLKVNDIIKLEKIYFDQSKYDLRPESQVELEKLYRTLRDNPKLKIQIAGHTDNVGDLRLNKYLSENRAKVIYTYLIRKNIRADRLQHVGYGHTRPVAPNDTEANKAQNRRVEFVVIAN